jgi:hypothetical protein
MAADPTKGPSLGHAELRLVLLLEDLERTIQSAEALANAGLEDEAIRLIDLQRDALSHLPEQIAADVAAPPRKRVRRLVLGAAAAAFTLAASLAGTLRLIGDDPLNATEVAQRISAAGEIQDPALRLGALGEAIQGLASLPANDPARQPLSALASSLARETARKHREEGRRKDPSIVRQALDLARAAHAQAPAPATSGSPLDDLFDRD